ncbi:hypothetical protein DXC96_28265 [Enterocloster bolteae]|nr:hypothetical protein DXC96_28265 [Enterocloster bolteae]
MTARGIMTLPHGSLKTWGEPCGARYKRRCGVMTAPPGAACNIPSRRNRRTAGGRGKYGGNKFSYRTETAAPIYAVMLRRP